jgi:RHS repeat-associated protein
MTTYGHNNLNQITAIGGSGGVKTVIVRGDTSEPASVKVKPGTSSTWKDAKMLKGRRFEADVDLATGPNQINVQATDGSNNTSNYVYALNLAAASAATPIYDDDGNMTSDGVRGFEWDMQNRLMKITWGGGSNKTTEFRYNPLGQRSERIEKTGTSETAHFYYLYDGIRLVCRYRGGTAATNIDRRYLGEGEQRKNGSFWDSFYYCRDHLGSIREVMNSNGTLAARYDYDPYGKRSMQYQAATYADGCDIGYTGHITQPSPVPLQTELAMTLFRAYDPELGRWLSADPIGEEGGLNLYGYVGGNSVNLYDPNGLSPMGTEGGGDYDQDNVSSFRGHGWSDLFDFIENLGNWHGPGTWGKPKNPNLICGTAPLIGPGSIAKLGKLGNVTKAVNSNLPHAAGRAVERGIFNSREAANRGLAALTSRIGKKGFPANSFLDPSKCDRVLVPIRNAGLAVYQMAKNGTAKLKTVLNAN